MSSEQIIIEVNARQQGKHNSRGLRKAQEVPAVVYGPKTKPVNISIRMNDAIKYSKHGFENSIFTLKSTDSTLSGLKVLKKQLDIHPLSRLPIHMDFFAPDMTKTVRVSVEIRYEGKPAGLKEGGIFNAVRRDVEIECLPNEIPEFISVDVSGMMLNDSMHVSDLSIPAGTELMTSEQETICTVAAVEEETVAAAPAAAAAATPAAAAGAAPAAAAAAPAGDKKSK